MVKKVIAFDLDGTLVLTKSPISDHMGELLVNLLKKYEVCIIAGGKFEQLKLQIIDRLEASPRELARLHLMPTSGTRYYRYDELSKDWQLKYSEDLTDEQKQRAISALEDGAKKLDLWEEKPYGDIIENRGSQITFSALGQKAPAELKYAWDPNDEKKHKLRDYVAPLVADLEVRVGGTTSVDITLIGIDKAYGMKKLIDFMNINKEDILFIGDKLEQGGNDYPVKAIGIDTIAVERCEDTALVLEGILGVTE
jgi:HAD-superfamily hydrolase, subfamily IIB